MVNFPFQKLSCTENFSESRRLDFPLSGELYDKFMSFRHIAFLRSGFKRNSFQLPWYYRNKPNLSFWGKIFFSGTLSHQRFVGVGGYNSDLSFAMLPSKRFWRNEMSAIVIIWDYLNSGNSQVKGYSSFIGLLRWKKCQYFLCNDMPIFRLILWKKSGNVAKGPWELSV